MKDFGAQDLNWLVGLVCFQDFLDFHGFVSNFLCNVEDRL